MYLTFRYSFKKINILNIKLYHMYFWTSITFFSGRNGLLQWKLTQKEVPNQTKINRHLGRVRDKVYPLLTSDRNVVLFLGLAGVPLLWPAPIRDALILTFSSLLLGADTNILREFISLSEKNWLDLSMPSPFLFVFCF